jgi:NAD(P)-dependent dehydrogenase (short-subunit alcohol dehydrogenase family)
MVMGILDGKVAIVTGASRGIGAQIARRFGQAGAAVAIRADLSTPEDRERLVRGDGTAPARR